MRFKYNEGKNFKRESGPRLLISTLTYQTKPTLDDRCQSATSVALGANVTASILQRPQLLWVGLVPYQGSHASLGSGRGYFHVWKLAFVAGVPDFL